MLHPAIDNGEECRYNKDLDSKMNFSKINKKYHTSLINEIVKVYL